MSLIKHGEYVAYEVVYTFGSDFYDPIFAPDADENADIIAYVLRGEGITGPVIEGPISFLGQGATIDSDTYIDRLGEGDYFFKYTIPERLLGGRYTAIIQTTIGGTLNVREFQFEVESDDIVFAASLPQGERNAVLNITNRYQPLNPYETNTIALIGHTDALQVNDIRRISSIQEAIDLLNGDSKSPLLRGVFDAYYAGARDIYIVPTAPMYEYIENVADRNTIYPFLISNEATPQFMTYYQKYYERLQESYSVLQDLDFLDIIVPLEASFFDTQELNFAAQLSLHCSNVYNQSGVVQLGILGARRVSTYESDVVSIETYLTNIEEDVTSLITESGLIIESEDDITALTTELIDIESIPLPGDENSEDVSKYVMLVYGEAIFNYNQINKSWTSPVSAALAGQISAHPIGLGLNRTKLSGSYSVVGQPITAPQLQRLHNLKVNTVLRGHRARRGYPNSVYISNDLTLARDGSVFENMPQLRLVAYTINEIKRIAENYIGKKFAQDEVVSDVRNLLNLMKVTTPPMIIDYSLQTYRDIERRGKIIFEISLVSAKTLQKIDFGILAGGFS